MPASRKYQKLPKATLRPETDFKNDDAYQAKAKEKRLHTGFAVDSGVGIVAGFNIAALYSLVKAAGTFISGLGAQIVFPLFMLIDLLELGNAWNNFKNLRAVNGGKWKGIRNAFARAVMTSILVPLSLFVVASSFIPGFLPGIAIALSFTAIMASRSIFNIGSGMFNLGRSKIAENPLKEIHADQSRIQLGVGTSNALSLAATISVFLLGGLGLATFSFAPIGIVAGIALVGVLSYAFYKSYQARKKVSQEMIEMRTIPEDGEPNREHDRGLTHSQRLHNGSKRTASMRIEAGAESSSSGEERASKKMLIDTGNPDEDRKKDSDDRDFNPRANEPSRQQSTAHDLMPRIDTHGNPMNDSHSFVAPGTPFSSFHGGTFAPEPAAGSTPSIIERPRSPNNT